MEADLVGQSTRRNLFSSTFLSLSLSLLSSLFLILLLPSSFSPYSLLILFLFLFLPFLRLVRSPADNSTESTRTQLGFSRHIVLPVKEDLEEETLELLRENLASPLADSFFLFLFSSFFLFFSSASSFSLLFLFFISFFPSPSTSSSLFSPISIIWVAMIRVKVPRKLFNGNGFSLFRSSCPGDKFSRNVWL